MTRELTLLGVLYSSLQKSVWLWVPLITFLRGKQLLLTFYIFLCFCIKLIYLFLSLKYVWFLVALSTINNQNKTINQIKILYLLKKISLHLLNVEEDIKINILRVYVNSNFFQNSLIRKKKIKNISNTLNPSIWNFLVLLHIFYINMNLF